MTFKRISPSQKKQLVDTTRTVFPAILAVYSFGSMVTGAVHAESDLDLAILPAQGALPVVQVWKLAQKLTPTAGREVDLVDLRTASSVLRLEVIAHGERLYCANEDVCAEFESFVYSDYARLNEERAAILADVQQRGSVYG